MTNLTNINSPQETILTQFETAQGWKVKIDLQTRLIYVSKRDLATLLEVSDQTLGADRINARLIEKTLRDSALSTTHKELKLSTGQPAHCFDEDQLFCILEKFNPPMYKASKKFGVKTAILQSCGLLETPQPEQPQLSAPAVIAIMAPYVELARDNIGLDQLVTKRHLIPCQILHDKPFELAYWVRLHYPSLKLSKGDMTRLGRELASGYRTLKTSQPKNGYTQKSNKYTKADHPLICQVFTDMLTSGRIG